MTSGDLDIDPSEKLTKNTFLIICNELSIALFCFSLRALAGELERGAVNCPPPPATACSAREAASARVNVQHTYCPLNMVLGFFHEHVDTITPTWAELNPQFCSSEPRRAQSGTRLPNNDVRAKACYLKKHKIYAKLISNKNMKVGDRG